jgi:hypothetical protein
MHVRITKNNQGRRYLQLAEAYRDPKTRKPKSRHIASLGRVSGFGKPYKIGGGFRHANTFLRSTAISFSLQAVN